MKPIIISCGASKIDVPKGTLVQAWTLYNGGYFKIMLDAATKYSNNIWILSAGYGLIPANAMIEPYDIKMNPKIAKFMRVNNLANFSGLSLLGNNYAEAVIGELEPLTPTLKMGEKMSYVQKLAAEKNILIDLHTLPNGGAPVLVTPSDLYNTSVNLTTISATSKAVIKPSSTNLLDTLKFVQGAVAKKTFIPELTHFCIEDSFIRSYNGSLALNSPIPLDINCKPKAIPFVQAIRKCTETVTMSLTPTGKLSIKSGAFRALVDCIDGETPHVLPTGERFDFNGETFVKTLKALQPFIGDDASVSWSNGVLLSGTSAYATNNVIVVEAWLGTQFPIKCNLPHKTVKEIVRIGLPPIYGVMDDMSITFFYEDGRWIRSNLLNSEWPDVASMLNIACNPTPIREDLFVALESLKDLTDEYGRVYLRDNRISTAVHDTEGASYELPDLQIEGVYQIKMLSLLSKIAVSADFSFYPRPCPFFGHTTRGIIVGLRS